MESININRMRDSIPLNVMPLNINFIEFDNRIVTYENYKGTMEAAKLSQMGLFLFDLPPFTLFCFFCGQPSSLTEDGSLPDGNIYHSSLCPLVPQSMSEERVALTNNVLEFIAAQISKHSHDPNDNLLDIGEKKDGDLKSLNVDQENKDDKNEEEARKNEQRAAQIEEFGFALDCLKCGDNNDVKTINIPCWHMPYCIQCAKSQSKCCKCDCDIKFFLPMFWQ